MAGMPDRINPRPVFRQAIALLEDARCPECQRAYDPVAASEDYCPRMVPLHCSWCSDRLRTIREFQAWQRQDAASLRSREANARQRKPAPRAS
jgi:hypothetical protein